MLKKLWRRVLKNQARHERLMDEVATERFLLDHELSERERMREVPRPPGRTNTDWTYVPPQ
jgi:hypothetical protein